MEPFSAWILPLLLSGASLWGARRHVDVYDALVTGGKSGLQVAVSILPALAALLTAVYMLRASGAFDILAWMLRPVTEALSIPADLVPLMLLRPVSGSGASAYVAMLLQQYGPDSELGRMASVLASSTDTTFYAASIYLGSVGMKKSGWILPAALLGDLTAAVVTVAAVRWFFS